MQYVSFIDISGDRKRLTRDSIPRDTNDRCFSFSICDGFKAG